MSRRTSTIRLHQTSSRRTSSEPARAAGIFRLGWLILMVLASIVVISGLADDRPPVSEASIDCASARLRAREIHDRRRDRWLALVEAAGRDEAVAIAGEPADRRPSESVPLGDGAMGASGAEAARASVQGR